jgi:hypothetical protein
MPFATSFDRARRLMITRAWGHTLPDLRAYQQELGRRPEFDPTWAHVFDARDAVQFDISSADIRGLADTSVLATSARRAGRDRSRDLRRVPHVQHDARTPWGRTRDRRVHYAGGSHRMGHVLTL